MKLNSKISKCLKFFHHGESVVIVVNSEKTALSEDELEQVAEWAYQKWPDKDQCFWRAEDLADSKKAAEFEAKHHNNVTYSHPKQTRPRRYIPWEERKDKAGEHDGIYVS